MTKTEKKKAIAELWSAAEKLDKLIADKEARDDVKRHLIRVIAVLEEGK